MCQASSLAWTAQNHRPQIPQRKVATRSQGSAMGEMASQDHSMSRASVRFTCCNIFPPRGRSIHLAVVAGCERGVALNPESGAALGAMRGKRGSACCGVRGDQRLSETQTSVAGGDLGMCEHLEAAGF